MTFANEQTVHLAIETTGRTGSVALLRGTNALRQVNLDGSERTAATLAPALQRMLAACRQQGHMPEFIAVADGPGSFTGLRIGVTTAKSLSYALKLPLVAVDSLAAIAAVSLIESSAHQSVAIVLNAYRNQVFTGNFERSTLLPDLNAVPGDWSPHPPTVRVLGQKDWDDELNGMPGTTAISGDAKQLGELANSALPRSCDALGVGQLAIRAASLGLWTDPLTLVPRYLKPSAAEEQAAAKTPPPT